jgi:hypothetical protein
LVRDAILLMPPSELDAPVLLTVSAKPPPATVFEPIMSPAEAVKTEAPVKVMALL